jgi:hypothetical protein
MIHMPFRAIIYSHGHIPNYIYLKDSCGDWVNFNGGSYRIDPKAVAVVVSKDGRRTNLVESFWREGNPIPLFSDLKIETVTQEHWDQKFALAGNKPAKGLWEMIRGR